MHSLYECIKKNADDLQEQNPYVSKTTRTPIVGKVLIVCPVSLVNVGPSAYSEARELKVLLCRTGALNSSNGWAATAWVL